MAKATVQEMLDLISDRKSLLEERLARLIRPVEAELGWLGEMEGLLGDLLEAGIRKVPGLEARLPAVGLERFAPDKAEAPEPPTEEEPPEDEEGFSPKEVFPDDTPIRFPGRSGLRNLVGWLLRKHGPMSSKRIAAVVRRANDLGVLDRPRSGKAVTYTLTANWEFVAPDTRGGDWHILQDGEVPPERPVRGSRTVSWIEETLRTRGPMRHRDLVALAEEAVKNGAKISAKSISGYLSKCPRFKKPKYAGEWELVEQEGAE